jgi:two-component system, OmpR family, response regulator
MDLSTIERAEAPLSIVPPRRVAEKNKTPLILIVDDDEDTIASVASIGRKAGYKVIGASGGEECLSMLSRIAPHLIMLDVNMPELDGFETCRRARLAPNGMLVPIAFLTARQTIEDVKRGVAAGGDEFIVKPFDARYLVERVALMISCAHALSAHRQRSSAKHGPPGAWLPARPRRRKIR